MSTNGKNKMEIVYSDSKAYNAECSVNANEGASSSYSKVNLYGLNGYILVGDNSSLGIPKMTKIGVQAPPGTRFIINGDKEIMMGRTGVYELDEDFEVTQLVFVRPKKYVLDENNTNFALNNGIEALSTAKKNFEEAVSKITAEPDTADYWKEYNSCYIDYMREYQNAYAQFLQGVNGIYKLPNSEDPNSDENFEELENIIIDFLF